MMKDNINPAHYRSQPVECIEFTQHLNFCLGNAFKYIWRYAEKNGIEDLKKAEWYLLRQMQQQQVECVMDFKLWKRLLSCLYECTFNGAQAAALRHIWEAGYVCCETDLPFALDKVRALIEAEERKDSHAKAGI